MGKGGKIPQNILNSRERDGLAGIHVKRSQGAVIIQSQEPVRSITES